MFPIYWLLIYWLPYLLIAYLLIAYLLLVTTEEKTIQIFVKLIHPETITIDMKPSDTVTVLKAKIQDKTGIAFDDQRLIWSTTQLEDGKTIGEYGIEESSKIELVSYLKGGGTCIHFNMEAFWAHRIQHRAIYIYTMY